MVASRRLRAPALAVALALAMLAAAAIAYAEPAAQKPVPHAIQGQEACLTCHTTGGVSPAPPAATHAGRTNAMCVMCHLPAAPAAPSAPPAAQPTPAKTPAPTVPAAPGAPTPVAPAAPTPTAPPVPTAAPDRNAACLACHASPALAMKLADGKQLAVFVDNKVFKESVHGKVNFFCTECHVAISGYPHPVVKAKDARDYTATMVKQCQQCHPANFSDTKDPIHALLVKDGNQKAAVCTDCHGIHDIRAASDPASSVNPKNLLSTCQKCHTDAPPNFTSAWTGHNRPSQSSAAPVFFVNLIYSVLIPVVVGGMLAYVLLDIMRSILNRRASGKARSAKEVVTKGGRSE
jgi:hypothetical protein